MLAACSEANPAKFVPRIQKEAQDYLVALNAGDEPVVAGRSPAKFLKLINGEVGQYLSRRNNGIRQSGFVIMSAAAGTPGTPQRAGGLLVSFVPVVTQMRYDDGGDFRKMRVFGPTALKLSNYLAALSHDRGRTWKFFEAEDESITAVLSDVKGKILIPSPLADATPY